MVAESKKMNIMNIMLRVLSVLAVNSFIYAGFTMLRAFIFHEDGGSTSVVLYLAIICFAHGAGDFFTSKRPLIPERIVQTKLVRFLTFLFNIRDSKGFISSLLMWGSIIVPAAATIVIFGGHGLERTIFELLTATVAYIVSLKQSRMSHVQVIGAGSIYTGMLIMVICLEIPYLVSRLEYLRPLYFGISYFIIFSFIIVKNQQDIDRQIFNKKHIDKSILPKNLRSFNMISAAFVFIIIMLLFNLKTVILYIMDIVKQVAQTVLFFLMWLLDKIMPDSSMASQPVGQSEMVSMPAQQPMPFVNLILNVVMHFLVFYVVYRILFSIIVRVPAAFLKIMAVLKKLFKINSGNEGYEGSDFVDMTETVLPDKQKTARRVKRKRTRAKKLNQITDPVEKVRHMYGNILGMLPLRGVEPDKAETAKEILAKAVKVLEVQAVQEGLSPFTEIYEQVRYGEIVPDGNMLAKAESYYEKGKGTLEKK